MCIRDRYYTIEKKRKEKIMNIESRILETQETNNKDLRFKLLYVYSYTYTYLLVLYFLFVRKKSKMKT